MLEHNNRIIVAGKFVAFALCVNLISGISERMLHLKAICINLAPTIAKFQVMLFGASRASRDSHTVETKCTGWP